VAQGYMLGILGAAEKGGLEERMVGHTVRLAAFGARRFENHHPVHGDALPLGMIAYQGCAVYAFAEPLPASILPRPPDDSVAGQRVWVSKGTESDLPDEDTYLVSLLQTDLMVVCNNREFFEEIVSRRRSLQKARALPADLPEWKQVDRTAPLWAVSHYVPHGLVVHSLDFGDAEKESEATGIAVEFGLASGVTRARMISKSDPWRNLSDVPDFHGAAKSRKVADGVWELTVSGDPEAANMSAFALMGMVGFIILL
jgi:hypothetical protein